MGEQSEAFLASFASQKRDIARQISENLDWKELLIKITAIRKEFVEATAILPSYELRQCELQLKELEAQIDSIRIASSAKSRFVFKRSTITPAKAEKPASVDLVPSTISTEAAPNIVHAPASSQLSITKRRDSLLTLDSINVKSQSSASTSQSSLLLAELESCVVDLLSPSEESPTLSINALHVRGLKRVVLISGYINGSVLFHDCEECLLILGCRQFRMHTSKNVSVQLYVASRPTIEHSRGITFAPYRSSSESEHLFPSEPSQHYTVQDFDWIKPTPSPNWTKSGANDAALAIVQAAIVKGADTSVKEVVRDVLATL